MLAGILCALLLACGGGGGGGSSPASDAGAQAAIPSAPDRDPPVILAQTLELNAQGQVSIDKDAQGRPAVRISIPDRQSRDNIDVTGHCLSPQASTPRPGDACFGESKAWQAYIGPAWHAWARDAAGNVSASAKALSPGPCSEQAYIASNASALPTVCIKTDQGEIVLELESEKAPNTVKNFLSYVQDGFYSGTVFHRVLAGSVLQGGGFIDLANVASNSTKTASRPAIALERTTTTGLSNVPASIVMARTNQPDTATTQFFINLRDNSASYDARDGQDGYAVFGRVIHGYEAVVLPISRVPLGGSQGDLPQQTIRLQWAYVMK